MDFKPKAFLAVACSFSLLQAFAGAELSMSGPKNASGNIHITPSPQYSFHVDAVDPTPTGNPAGANVAGFRGAGQLIIYTPTFGSTTQTNQAGTEATVVDGIITRTGAGNSAIPNNGWVISAHGAAAQWLKRFGCPGARVAYRTAPENQISIQFTPSVYLQRVNEALDRVQKRSPVDEPSYRQHLAAAQACRQQLMEEAGPYRLDPVSLPASWLDLADRCEQEANRAFYDTIAVWKDDFRGAWIRPDNASPERIAETVARMKRLGIRNIFLETYYQGETIYPSAVMSSYGLSPQHPRFRGGDPLQAWIDAAHKEGLKTHAWVQVFFAGNRDENAESGGPILQKYPQWRNIERGHWDQPKPVASDVEPGHYFLDPANPEVRQFLEKLFLEITERYAIDGLNLDYIRYPASRPVNNPAYLATTWGYTDTARNNFKTLIEKEREQAEEERRHALEAAGRRVPLKSNITMPSADPKDLTPSSPLWPRWVSWRKEQVSMLVHTISDKAHAAHPNLLISAVVFPASDPTYAQKLQDYPRWTREGWIQALTPIGLSTHPEKMALQAIQIKAQVPEKVPVYVGIFSLYNREPVIDMLQQMEALEKVKIPGMVFFDWSRINDEYEEALLQGPFRP